MLIEFVRHILSQSHRRVKLSVGDATAMVVFPNIVLKSGQLGHGDWANRTSPQLINSLRSMKITQASCGLHHTALLSGYIH